MHKIALLLLLLPCTLLAARWDGGYPVFTIGERFQAGDVVLEVVHDGYLYAEPSSRAKEMTFNIIYTTGGSEISVGEIMVQYYKTTAEEFMDARKQIAVGRGDTHRTFGEHVRIRYIEVKDSYRRKGIATKALNLLIQTFRELDGANFARFKAEISAYNRGSLELFSGKAGFKKIPFSWADVGFYELPRDPAQHYCVVCDAETSKKCARCQSVYYCGRAHQQVDWKRGHRRVCVSADE